LSKIETGECLIRIDDDLVDVHLFRVEAVPKELEEITNFLKEARAPKDLPTNKQKNPSHERCTIHSHEWISLQARTRKHFLMMCIRE
jgi:hypothetical protein